MATVKTVALASIFLKGYPRWISKPRLVCIAWCQRCRTTHSMRWRPSWNCNHQVGPVKTCRAFRAALDDEAKAQLPELIRQLVNCRRAYKAWLAEGVKPSPGSGQRLGRVTGRGDFDDDGS
jgi:hypothetical protein